MAINTSRTGAANNMQKEGERFEYPEMVQKKELQRKINEDKSRKVMGMIIKRRRREMDKYEHGRCLWKMAVYYCLNGAEITHFRGKDTRKLEIM